MKTQSEIEDRIRFLLAQERDRRIAVSREKLPGSCRHNHQQPLDGRKQVEGEPNENFNRITDRRGLPVLQTMGLCMLGSENPDEWQGTICDEPIDAQQCPYFEPKASPEEIETEFRAQMQDMEWARVNMPEVHALLWALEASEPIPVPVTPEPPTLEQAIETYHEKPLPEPEPVPLSWWKRVLLSWILGVPARGMRVLPPKGE